MWSPAVEVIGTAAARQAAQETCPIEGHGDDDGVHERVMVCDGV